MKEVGNLAVVCARRHDVLMQILNGVVTVHMGHGPERVSFSMDWHDDEKARDLITQLNHGQYRDESHPGEAVSA